MTFSEKIDNKYKAIQEVAQFLMKYAGCLSGIVTHNCLMLYYGFTFRKLTATAIAMLIWPPRGQDLTYRTCINLECRWNFCWSGQAWTPKQGNRSLPMHNLSVVRLIWLNTC